MTPVTEILTLLKIFFSPFFIINVCQNFNGQLTFLYVTVVQKSNSVTQFGDENNDKKQRIKVRRWTLKIIFIHKIFTISMVTIHLTHQPSIWPQNYNIYQRNIQFYQFSIVIGSNTIFLLILFPYRGIICQNRKFVLRIKTIRYD